MNAADLMTRTVATCRPEDSLNLAAGLMWNHDCGCVVVVDDAGRPAGIVTDRDICMAAWNRGGSLDAHSVGQVMSTALITGRAQEPLTTIHATLREHQLHRLPIVDDSGAIVGILSLADLAGAPDSSANQRTGETCAAVKRPRSAAAPVTIQPAAVEPEKKRIVKPAGKKAATPTPTKATEGKRQKNPQRKNAK